LQGMLAIVSVNIAMVLVASPLWMFTLPSEVVSLVPSEFCTGIYDGNCQRKEYA
jgi:hypothetical protein